MTGRWIIIVVVVALAGCHAPQVNAPPDALGRLVEEPARYFVCDKCGSLDGGNYAAKATKQLRTAEGQSCVHDWYPISKSEFREVAAERFGIDWSLEAPFWSAQDKPDKAAAPASPPASRQDNSPGAD